MNFITYMSENMDQILSLLVEHIELTFLAVAVAILIGVPIGILISYVKKLGKTSASSCQCYAGDSFDGIVRFYDTFFRNWNETGNCYGSLVFFASYYKNTYIGIQNINADMLEAARGIGLTKWQILVKVRIPLALPVIMGGIRISAVSAVGLMTLLHSVEQEG